MEDGRVKPGKGKRIEIVEGKIDGKSKRFFSFFSVGIFMVFFSVRENFTRNVNVICE